MNIDHIFIFSQNEGKEADDLVDFGLSEGSSRYHIGQGTRNRKFHFRNFFLEIIWVQNEKDIKNMITRPSELYKRAELLEKDISPFGLCISNTEDSDELFKNTYRYQPEYFPEGFPIELIKNENQPSLPWTFRLPMIAQRSHGSEPIDHAVGLKNLTGATFEYSGAVKDDFLTYFDAEDQIHFEKSSRNWLTLSFDEAKEEKSKEFKEISLTIRY
ncbi:MAG: hypothetical protein ACFHWX_05445 [Bacteroidota bacterium]